MICSGKNALTDHASRVPGFDADTVYVGTSLYDDSRRQSSFRPIAGRVHSLEDLASAIGRVWRVQGRQTVQP